MRREGRFGAWRGVARAAALIGLTAFALGGCSTKETMEGLDRAPVPGAGSVGTPMALSVAPDYQPFAPDDALSICPKIIVTNSPPVADDRVVTTYAPYIQAAPGVNLLIAPTKGACLTSGFGPRRSRLHKGIDLQNREAPMVVAAGEGIVVRKIWRDDYGNMVLLDHGGGVYTRYAHLARFEPELKVGERIAAGAPLGPMGNSSKWHVALHLHYEILAGDLGNPKGSFGLTPLDPFDLPPAAQPL